MHVSAASTGQPGVPQLDLVAALPEVLPLPPAPAPVQSLIEDRVGGHLPEIAAPAIHAALHLPSDAAVTDALIHQAVDALTHHDVPGALRAVGELLRTQPETDVRVLHEPALEPVRPEIRDLVAHLTAGAKQDAEKTVAHAGVLVANQPPGAFGPTTVALANQFLETGQYVNYIRAGEMGRLVVATCASKGREKAESPATARIAKAVGSLWRRAPLLALLIAWMLLGLVVVPLSAEFWALGFLALIGFQFVVTIRNRARR